MQTVANTYLIQFNTTIDTWIGFLGNYTLKMLHQKPGSQSWSLGQVYMHIIQDTEFYVGQMKAALLTGGNAGKQMHASAKAMLANNAFPDMRLENPNNSLSLRQPKSIDELRQGLAGIKEQAGVLFASFDIATSTGKTEHPGFQFLTALEWLRFADMHLRHHLQQKKRIDEALLA